MFINKWLFFFIFTFRLDLNHRAPLMFTFTIKLSCDTREPSYEFCREVILKHICMRFDYCIRFDYP